MCAPRAVAGGVADWVNQRLAEQAKNFEDGDELVLEPKSVEREQRGRRGFAGARGGSSRSAGAGAEPRFAVGLELAFDQRTLRETDGVAALFGQANRVALELWLGAPTGVRAEAAIGPSLHWSRQDAVFVRIGGAAAWAFEPASDAALLDLGTMDLGVQLDRAWFFEPSARARGRVTLRESGSGSALLGGAGARLLAPPFALEGEWLVPIARAGTSERPELEVELCSLLGGPSLCAAAARAESTDRARHSEVRLELRFGWGSWSRTRY